jgi:hypothetical protein
MSRPNSLFRGLQSRSIGIYRRISDGMQWGVAQQETTITETMLLSLRQSNPEVSVRQLNVHEEGREGADWEWWFQGRDRWFHALVQAKRLTYLRNGSLGYQVDYKSGKSRIPQHELLLAAAKARGAVPLYVLYNGPRIVMPRSWPCGLLRPRRDLIGASFLPGESVANRAKLKTIDQGSIRGLDWPLPCIVCPWSERRCSWFSPVTVWPQGSTWKDVVRVRLGFPSDTSETDPALLPALAYVRSLLALRVGEFHRLDPIEQPVDLGEFVADALTLQAPSYIHRILEADPRAPVDISDEEVGPFPPVRVVIVKRDD